MELVEFLPGAGLSATSGSVFSGGHDGMGPSPTRRPASACSPRLEFRSQSWKHPPYGGACQSAIGRARDEEQTQLPIAGSFTSDACEGRAGSPGVPAARCTAAAICLLAGAQRAVNAGVLLGSWAYSIEAPVGGGISSSWIRAPILTGRSYPGRRFALVLAMVSPIALAASEPGSGPAGCRIANRPAQRKCRTMGLLRQCFRHQFSPRDRPVITSNCPTADRSSSRSVYQTARGLAWHSACRIRKTSAKSEVSADDPQGARLSRGAWQLKGGSRPGRRRSRCFSLSGK